MPKSFFLHSALSFLQVSRLPRPVRARREKADLFKAWFIASFLPLPPGPVISGAKGKKAVPRTQFDEDFEKQLGPIDEARYENARWWRNINQILSAFGILIIITVVS